MGVLIVGSIALDTVETPYGTLKNGLGGSATYGSVAASFFSPARIVGVVGSDFPECYLSVLEKRKIDLLGLQKITKGRTFKWSGSYDEKDLNSAITRNTELNVFADFHPSLPEEYKNSRFVFLGNIHPSLQIEVLDQLNKPKFVMVDSMNLWINTTRHDLIKVIKRVDLVLLNETEAKMLCDTNNLMTAARKVLALGPKFIIIKKGEHGAMLVSNNEVFIVPAFPIEKVVDPTGAGDSFAGALIGYMASKDKADSSVLRQSLAVGSVIASFNVEDFSLNKMLNLKKSQIKSRLKLLAKLTSFNAPEF